MEAEDDDARHRRDEAERRAKRYTAKISKPQSQRAKEGAEYRRKILEKHGAKAASSSGKNKKGGRRKEDAGGSDDSPSIFQNLFAQRAEGFQIEFKFRNAPPRPPVGPCFVGNPVDAILKEQSRQYKPYNAVEVNYAWNLHIEPDLGVPLAPSAMDLKSYSIKNDKRNKGKNGNVSYQHPVEGEPPLHRDDEALLDWKGSLGDTAAEALKLRQDRARAAARAALLEGKPIRSTHMGIGGVIAHTTVAPPTAAKPANPKGGKGAGTGKKKFSRVLDETMQSWMKKTTYLSNDYSRKVHDFQSLAKTKQLQEKELEEKQQLIAKRRSAQAIQKSFITSQSKGKNNDFVHPTKKHLKVKQSFPLLPSVEHWKYPYTHVVMDKPPINVDLRTQNINIDRSFVANVEKRPPNNRLTCQLWMPPKEEQQDKGDEKQKQQQYQPLQQYDLDVLPLKEEDIPHFNFCFWIDHQKDGAATYVPISSRVQLSAGRPIRKPFRKVARRELSEEDQQEMNERVAEIDHDMAQKLGKPSKKRKLNGNDANGDTNNNNDDDDDDDDDDGVNAGMKINNADDDSSSDDDDEL